MFLAVGCWPYYLCLLPFRHYLFVPDCSWFQKYSFMVHACMSTDDSMTDVCNFRFDTAFLRPVVTWVNSADVVYLSIVVPASLPATGVQLHASGN